MGCPVTQWHQLRQWYEFRQCCKRNRMSVKSIETWERRRKNTWLALFWWTSRNCRQVFQISSSARFRRQQTHLWRITDAAIICQIVAFLNSRSLYTLGNDLVDLHALTPDHFPINSHVLSVPEPWAASIPIVYINTLHQWQKIQQMRKLFCQQWKNDYLSCHRYNNGRNVVVYRPTCNSVVPLKDIRALMEPPAFSNAMSPKVFVSQWAAGWRFHRERGRKNPIHLAQLHIHETIKMLTVYFMVISHCGPPCFVQKKHF